MSSSRLLPAPTLLLVSLLVSGCGGLPDGYGDALIDATGPVAVVCLSGTEPSVIGVLGIENPGELSMEIRSVDFTDASPQPVEYYVMEVPTGSGNVIGGVGGTALAEAFGHSPQLAAAWQDRQRLPTEIRPGFTAEVVIVLDRAVDPVAVNYVNEIEVTVAVGDQIETASFESLRMAGTAAGCEATAIELKGDG